MVSLLILSLVENQSRSPFLIDFAGFFHLKRTIYSGIEELILTQITDGLPKGIAIYKPYNGSTLKRSTQYVKFRPNIAIIKPLGHFP